MKYVSLDIETTGLEPKRPENIIGLSFVVEDTDRPDVPLRNLPSLTLVIDQGRFEGEPYALSLNSWLFDMIVDSRKGKDTQYRVVSWGDGNALHNTLYGYVPYGGWEHLVLDFLEAHFGNKSITVAGKNVAGFDMQFMTQIIQRRFKHRVIDVGSVFADFIRPNPIPSLDELKKEHGMGDVSHDMYDDALDVIALLRKKYTKQRPIRIPMPSDGEFL